MLYTMNLTQHPATAEQVAVGVRDLEGEDLATLKELLTFDTRPTREEVAERASKLAQLAVQVAERDRGCVAVMIGGAPFLMGPLTDALYFVGHDNVLFAFSTRVVEEAVQPDGSIKKVSVFRHAGFVEA